MLSPAPVVTSFVITTSKGPVMKRNPLIALAVTAGIAAAAVSIAACSTTSPGTPTAMTSRSGTASPPSATKPTYPVGYWPQVVLPFGNFINHLAGVTVDTAGNVYVLDLRYGQVWKMAAGSRKPAPLPFTDLGQSV